MWTMKLVLLDSLLWQFRLVEILIKCVIYCQNLYVYIKSWAWWFIGNNIIILSPKFNYCKSRIFRMHFIFLYFVRDGFSTKIKIHTKSSKQVRESASGQWLYENCMHTKGRRSPTYGNLVHTKYSGFAVPFSHILKLASYSLLKPLSMIKPLQEAFYHGSSQPRTASDSKKLSQLLRASRVQWRHCCKHVSLQIDGTS